jgi:GDPmannose 4,6-dehydratase
MKAIIFGSNGQDGFYLSRLLESEGIETIGVSRSNKGLYADIANYSSVAAFIQSISPDFIFHLAANSSTRHEVWQENHETISTGTLNILEAVYRHSSRTKVFISGSGLQFQNHSRPISENDPFDSTCMYALSRIHSAWTARHYRGLGLKVYIGYFFNHDSPRRPPNHINQKVIRAVKEIAAGNKKKLEIGNLKVRKEFGFAGDIVKGIWTLISQEDIFEAAIGTGKAFTIQDWIEYCFRHFQLNWQEHVVSLPGYKAEYDILVSDPATIFSLGWQPATSFEKLADMMINDSK